MKGVLVAEDDSVVPDFKYSIKSSPYVMDESKVESWDVVRNINNYIPCAYEKVKHLEDTVISPRPAIEIRTAMEICRIRKLEIGEYFDLTKAINDLVYRQMSRQPIYNTIPKKLRGKAYCT